MPSSRTRSAQRVMRHLWGWRIVILTVSCLPVLAVLAWWTKDWGAAFLLTGALFVLAATVATIVTFDTSRVGRIIDQLLGPGHRVVSDLESMRRRLDVIDLVLSSETRRSWEPTTLPLPELATTEAPKPVLLLPGADYHLPEVVALADELDLRGIPNIIAVGVPHWDRTGDGLNWYHRDIYQAPSAEEVGERFSALVTMKDWAGYGPLVEAAKAAGLPTFAKVEGAQDFHDVDTSQPRNPYRTAGHILCQGKNDYDALPEMTRTIVGSTRLERLWWGPPANPPSHLAVINLNFTYGMLTSARDLWLNTAIEGCEQAGIPYVISIHPAERARSPHPKSSALSGSRLLRHATVLISRFSTLPYEAMARGVPFVYHNPHDESVPAFKEPMGAFFTTTGPGQLREALERLPPPGGEVRDQVAEFFARQVDIDSVKRSEIRSAELISRALL